MTCYKTHGEFTWSVSPPSPDKRVIKSEDKHGGSDCDEKMHQKVGGRHCGVGQGHISVSSQVQECFQEVQDLVLRFIQASDLSVQGEEPTLIKASINADGNIDRVITCGWTTDLPAVQSG